MKLCGTVVWNVCILGLEKTDEMVLRCGINKDKNVLDVGAGKGVTPCYLAEKYKCAVVGIDHSEKMIEEARERAKKKGLEDRVSFRKADIHNLPFDTVNGQKIIFQGSSFVILCASSP